MRAPDSGSPAERNKKPGNDNPGYPKFIVRGPTGPWFNKMNPISMTDPRVKQLFLQFLGYKELVCVS